MDADVGRLCRALRIVAAGEAAKIPHGVILKLKDLKWIVVEPEGRYRLSDRGKGIVQRLERGDMGDEDFMHL